ncbi:hypothetical protein [Microbacterium capsulatum]|uniref:Uncharacterized protein n=1 Tax=Microbacterium capsulatum TaxID=3041921 RepID=A0ABU0XK53_9MICO|nr:hypothetical protein [Microbacterium sp. ASV81]MDQ4215014.1 hypothetical protein [Microbacterium sp. ASV81]
MARNRTRTPLTVLVAAGVATALGLAEIFFLPVVSSGGFDPVRAMTTWFTAQPASLLWGGFAPVTAIFAVIACWQHRWSRVIATVSAGIGAAFPGLILFNILTRGLAPETPGPLGLLTLVLAGDLAVIVLLYLPPSHRFFARPASRQAPATP